MLFQVGFSSLLVLTRMIYYAYYVLGPTLTGYDRLIGSFLMSFTTLVYYSNYAKSFYIYTLSSQLFRSVFLHRMKLFVGKILGQYALVRCLHTTMDTVETTVTTHTQHPTEYKRFIYL
jgi:hypothetical protein